MLLEDGKGVLADFDAGVAALDRFESVDKGDAKRSRGYDAEGIGEDAIDYGDEVLGESGGRGGGVDVFEESFVALLLIGGSGDLLDSFRNLRGSHIVMCSRSNCTEDLARVLRNFLDEAEGDGGGSCSLIR